MEKQTKPTVEEIEELLKTAMLCLHCDAPECSEVTPGGVEVCSGLHFWRGKPVTRQILQEWAELVRAQPTQA